MDSGELLQHLPASDLSLCLLFLELWLKWTPMDSSGLFAHARSVTLSQTLTPMDSYWLSWTLGGSSSFWLKHVSTNYTPTLSPINSYWLFWPFLSGSLSYSFSHSDSYELIQHLPASDLSLCLLILKTLTQMNSCGLQRLGQWLFLKLLLIWTPMDSVKLLQHHPASELGLCLLILELWLPSTHMD